jgi:hypothetical protein
VRDYCVAFSGWTRSAALRSWVIAGAEVTQARGNRAGRNASGAERNLEILRTCREGCRLQSGGATQMHAGSIMYAVRGYRAKKLEQWYRSLGFALPLSW